MDPFRWRVGLLAAALGALTAAAVVHLGAGHPTSADAATWHGAALDRPAHAQEFVVGGPVERNGLEIAANYLVGITLEPTIPLPANLPDAIHLEADVHATAANRHGFQAGEWVPYVAISYHVAKVGSDWSATGSLQPMVDRAGPHYAVNAALSGPGQYRVTYHLDPPLQNGFFRHTDAATGVPAWWEPFEVAWTFTFPSTPRAAD
jgi:uncharacterized protein involved in high-affinity Fe2+ transport